MRTSREYYKPTRADTLLHVYNHCIDMPPGLSLFGDIEKHLFINIINRHIQKYHLGLVAFHVMNNHFHLIMHCPKEKFSPEEAAIAYNNFHTNKTPISAHSFYAINLAKNSNNISEFMREVQIAFSKEFNKTRSYKRRGAVWFSRFKCQLIDTEQYFLTCLYYVELNGVRSGIDKNPEDSLFSSYGLWSSTGTHPHQDFMIKFLDIIHSGLSLEGFKQKLELNMQRLRVLDELKSCTNSATREILESQLSGVSHEIRKQYEFVQKSMTTFNKVIGGKDFKSKHNSNWNERNKASP